MIKVVTQTTIDEYERRIRELESLVEGQGDLLRKLNEDIHDVQNEHTEAIGKLVTAETLLDQKELAIQELNRKLDPIANSNTVTLSFDDNLINATPIIRYKQEVSEKLIELGYITDANADKFSIQLGLMTMASEVLTQLIDSFTE